MANFKNTRSFNTAGGGGTTTIETTVTVSASTNQLTNQATPPTSSSGLELFSSSSLGRSRPFVVDTTGNIFALGVDYPVKGRMGFTGATPTFEQYGLPTFFEFGTTTNITGLDTNSLRRSLLRRRYRQTGADLGAVLSETRTLGSFWRGSLTGSGGFDVTIRASWTTGSAGQFSLFGFCDDIGSGTPFADPITNTNTFGVGFSTGTLEGDLCIMSCGPTGERFRATATGARDGDSVYSIRFYAPVSGTFIAVKVENLSSGTIVFDQVVTGTALPAANVFMSLIMVNNVQGGGLPTEFEVISINWGREA